MKSRCRFTRINGARCAMPALIGHDLCFQHHQRKRQAQRKAAAPDPNAPAPLVDLVYMDDHTSVLANLNAIAEAFSLGRIDHRQVGALTRLIQTCLKTLHQKNDLEHYNDYYSYDPADAVKDVTYDDDGLPLAVDPPPGISQDPEPPQPLYPVRRAKKAVSKPSAAFASPEPAASLAPKPPASADPDPAACFGQVIHANADPELAASFAPSNPHPTSFPTLTSKPEDKPPVFNHLSKSPKTGPVFSNTSATSAREARPTPARAASPDPNVFLKRILFPALEREGIVCARKMAAHGVPPSTIDTGHQ